MDEFLFQNALITSELLGAEAAFAAADAAKQKRFDWNRFGKQVFEAGAGIANQFVPAAPQRPIVKLEAPREPFPTWGKVAIGGAVALVAVGLVVALVRK